ncbi:glycosyltransferase family 1 protein [Pusillimonas caeni]|uniref:glycosyltransferase n=1 Tax=Pusillimonas caeni TaxID=1348472 RepID=UPI000E59AF66|nr:glycosyltransferase [Pusillimonas caeni]TFL14037.1 glycosyltransferase family 1 protein [Pusillimonas caeni]
MKILYTNFHNSPDINGHVTYISTLLKNLNGRHALYVATPAESALYRIAQEIAGTRVFAMPFRSSIHRIPRYAKKLRAILKQEQIDVVHVNGSTDHKVALAASKFLKNRPKIIFTKHNDVPIKFIGSLLRARLGTDAIIAVCTHVKHMLKDSQYKEIPLYTIPNGVDTSYFTPASEAEIKECRKRIFGDAFAHKFVVGSNAGTSDYKNWMDMIRAVAKLDPMKRNMFHVAVAGAPIKDEQLREIESLSMTENFTYVGMLDDVRCFNQAIDIGYVLSSRVETISFACREMMACGKPVIVTDYSGLPENISDRKDGWIVPIRSPEVVSKILAGITDQEFDLRAMGKEAREKASQHFGVEKFVEETERAYTATTATTPFTL